jgi:dienelactone hydrolase
VAEIMVYHHALGLTPGIVAFADRLRQAGHVVHTPDLFDGRTFDDLEKGMKFVNGLGFSQVMERGERAVEGLPAELVYVGFSLGVVPAQKLAQTRAGACGALLIYSCVPVSEFGSAWPKGVPVQVHAMSADPFFIADASLSSYDAEATTLLMQRALDFVAAL